MTKKDLLEVCVVDVDPKVFKKLINDHGGIDDIDDYYECIDLTGALNNYMNKLYPLKLPYIVIHYAFLIDIKHDEISG